MRTSVASSCTRRSPASARAELPNITGGTTMETIGKLIRYVWLLLVSPVRFELTTNGLKGRCRLPSRTARTKPPAARRPRPRSAWPGAYDLRSSSHNPLDPLLATIRTSVAFAAVVPSTQGMGAPTQRRTASQRSNQSAQPDVIPDLWFKNAIIYNLDVRSFMDADGNGLGDFRGLTGRLDYLAGLGVTCVWLMPFYPTPDRDDGYDVTDYYGVDARYGDLGEFVEFTRAADQRGIRVIADLVVNHTSVEHPWFKEARSSPEARYRDWYIWSKKRPRDWNRGMVFPGVQKSTWSFDDAARAWYLHRFYEFQPDLNTSHPEVQQEIRRIMGYWLAVGVNGFRMDAVPFIIGNKGPSLKHNHMNYDLLRDLRAFANWRRGD